MSTRNTQEADLVKKIIEKLVQDGASPEAIGVISPYAAQISYLYQILEEVKGVEIATVDGFQGREKDIIVISFVRCNDNGEVGFLNDKKRLNVSITRAKQLLIVVGDAATLG